MEYLIYSAYSTFSKRAGIFILERDNFSNGIFHEVLLDNLPVRLRQVRGISIANDRLYAVIPCGLIIFKLDFSNRKKILRYEKIIIKNEWVIGDENQGDLHAVYASVNHQRVFVSHNSNCAIESFTLDGRFLNRRYLWDIAPEAFDVPNNFSKNSFVFGKIKQIFEDENKDLFATVSAINNMNKSYVINISRESKIALEVNKILHGGIIIKDTLFTSSFSDSAVLAFKSQKNKNYFKHNPAQKYVPEYDKAKWGVVKQIPRGIGISGNRLYCGVCYFGSQKIGGLPHRIVEFDVTRGRQVKIHWLPEVDGLILPQIYSITSTTDANTAFSERMIGINVYQHRTINMNDKIYTSSYFCFGTRKRQPKNSIYREKYSDQKIEGHVKYKSNDTPKYLTTDNKISDKLIVEFVDVGIKFNRKSRRYLSFNKNLRKNKSFWALKNISFSIKKGETLGIIGRNGSGKTTLSMACARVLLPDTGRINIAGKTQLLSFGVGFKVELSGRENIFISGSLLGLKKKEISERLTEIIDFADIGEFIDEPVRNYSSGMKSRLGFAIATAVKPDILILDEVLATGDKSFKNKAMKKISDLKGLANCVIIISHNTGQLKKLTTKILWIEKGRMIMQGDPKTVLKEYELFCSKPEQWIAERRLSIEKNSNRRAVIAQHG
jgi:ABC-type polysaccharide/polyol phosphate transport system ATPase subunit